MIDLNKEKYSVPTLEFGTGDIRINSGFIDDIELNIGAVTFLSQKPQKIDDITCFCDPKEGEYGELQFLFTKTESIDVLINSLLSVKNGMVAFEEAEHVRTK